MSDVFVSYKRDDEMRVARLVRALQAAGFTVYWDRLLPGNTEWRAELTRELDAAKVVVVCWTRASVDPQGGAFVQDEAGRAGPRLVQVKLDAVRPPLGFGARQAVDLVHWRGRASDPFFRDLVDVVRATLEQRPPPPPRGPMIRAFRRFTIGGGATTLLASGTVFALNVLGVQDTLCRVPPVAVVGDSCGAWGLGHAPTRAERLAWAARLDTCDALREHLRQFPGGAFADDASRRLAARSTAPGPPRPVHFEKASYVRQSATPFADPEQARTDALDRAGIDSRERLCAGVGRTDVRAAITATQYDCRRVGRGTVCALDFVATCEAKEATWAEVCPP